MSKKLSVVPERSRSRPRLAEKKVVQPPPLNSGGTKLRLWLATLFTLGVIILVVVSLASLGLFKGLFTLFYPPSAQAPVTTFNVGRTAPYAGLQFTVVNAQYATAFPDDNIHMGQAVVRLNMRVANPTSGTIQVTYYDDARLLVAGTNPIMPSNVRLSLGPKPGASATGWIDFPVSSHVQLSALKLRLGSSALDESLVVIPFSGKFDASQYADRTARPDFAIYYTFEGYTLTYHIVSVDIRYDYHGAQCKAGQQFYTLHFLVDNPNGVAVSPGFGYDYVRLVLSDGNRAPVDNTLPYGFNANKTGTPGSVTFAAPAGLKTIIVAFLSQNGSPQSNYTVNI
ncbi:MAG TPA: hypothetical protein VKV40_12210 [Ktedonobacteraceae bacterium]|nr:hypothetical protein [Ktedonobacteraceae bacterium]